MTWTKGILLGGVLAAMAAAPLGVSARVRPPVVTPPRAAQPHVHPHPEIATWRLENQQDRIQKGLANGSITRAEFNRVEAQIHAIKDQRRDWMRAQGGKLTVAQKAQLERELNQTSVQILRIKHNPADQRGF